MKTLPVSIVAFYVSTAVGGQQLAAMEAAAQPIIDVVTKASKVHGAARDAVIGKAVRGLVNLQPMAAYMVCLKVLQLDLWGKVLKATWDFDHKNGRSGGWKATAQAALISAIRAGLKFRNREVAEMVFLKDIKPMRLEELALWGELDSALERMVWLTTGWAKDKTVNPAICIVRTETDGKLVNDEEGSSVTFTVKDDPAVILESLSHMGLDPEQSMIMLEEILKKGEVTIDTTPMVCGEAGDITTRQGFSQLDEADKWLRQNDGETQLNVLYHRPAMVDDVNRLLEDEQVVADLSARGASVWADSLPAQLVGTPMERKLWSEEGEPVKGRKALRKILTSLALWQVQGDTLVKMPVPNDTGSLTAGGKYRPGETTIEVSLRERARMQYLAHEDSVRGVRADITTDFERVQASDKLWNEDIPTLEKEYLLDTLRASQLMHDSLLMSGLDIPLDSIAFDQVAMAMVDLPTELPVGIRSKPVTNDKGIHMRDDSGRLLFWVTPFNNAWTQEGKLSDEGKTWARFVLDMRAKTREVDSHMEGYKEALTVLDSIIIK